MQRAHLLLVTGVFACLTMTAGCGSTVVVRAPAPCPLDPYCIDEKDDAGKETRSVDPERVREFVRRNVESTVTVRTVRRANGGMYTALGVGTLLGRRGLVITSHQAVTNGEYVTIAYHRLSEDGATITEYGETPMVPLISNRELGVALLVPRDRDAPSVRPFPVLLEPIIKGDVVWHVGRGTSWGRDVVTDDRVVFSYKRFFVSISTAAKPMDAGGPILDACGRVIGILIHVDEKGVGLVIPLAEAFTAFGVTQSDLR